MWSTSEHLPPLIGQENKILASDWSIDGILASDWSRDGILASNWSIDMVTRADPPSPTAV